MRVRIREEHKHESRRVAVIVEHGAVGDHPWSFSDSGIGQRRFLSMDAGRPDIAGCISGFCILVERQTVACLEPDGGGHVSLCRPDDSILAVILDLVIVGLAYGDLPLFIWISFIPYTISVLLTLALAYRLYRESTKPLVA